MFLLGICGGSGSGKTTLARRLSERFEGRTVIIRQDDYYHDNSLLPFEERCAFNYDAPTAFEHDELLTDVQALLRGESILSKGYDYVNHVRKDPLEVVSSNDLIILEGIHAFCDERLRALFDLKAFVKVDSDVALLRRLKRDIRDRGRTLESVTNQYLATVKPMFDEYIHAYAKYADIIIPEGGKSVKIADMLEAYIRTVIH